MRYSDCFRWTRLYFIVCCQRCLYTQSRRYKQLGTYNRRVLLLYGGGGGGGGGGGRRRSHRCCCCCCC